MKALMEAKRVLKDEGTILVAYTMNEYSVLVYGFRENHIQECLENGKLDANYQDRALIFQNTLRLHQRLYLIFLCIKVIHRSKQDDQVKFLIRKT